jgi:hypothetical protein
VGVGGLDALALLALFRNYPVEKSDAVHRNLNSFLGVADLLVDPVYQLLVFHL